MQKLINQQEQLIALQTSLLAINSQILAEVSASMAGGMPKPECVTEEVPESSHMPHPPTLYNRKEAAAFLLVHPRTVSRYRATGKLQAVRDDDNRTRYRQEDLEACYRWKWGTNP